MSVVTLGTFPTVTTTILRGIVDGQWIAYGAAICRSSVRLTLLFTNRRSQAMSSAHYEGRASDSLEANHEANDNHLFICDMLCYCNEPVSQHG